MSGALLAIALAAATALPGCGGSGAVGGKHADDAATAAQFAVALKVAPDKVSTVASVRTTTGEVLLVGLVSGPQGDQRAELVAGRLCADRRFCPTGTVHLDEVDDGQVLAVDVLATIDLGAPPKSIGLATGAGQWTEPTTPGRAPALLLRTRRAIPGPGGNFESESLVLVGLGAPPSVLAKEDIRRRAPTGSGFETTELKFEPAPAGDPERPDLLLVQHALPARGAPEQLPGPPLTIRLRAIDRVGKAESGPIYQRVEPAQ